MATASGSGSARTRQCARSEAGTVPVCARSSARSSMCAETVLDVACVRDAACPISTG